MHPDINNKPKEDGVFDDIIKRGSNRVTRSMTNGPREIGRNIDDPEDSFREFVMSGKETGLHRQLGGVDDLGFGVFATQDFCKGDYICQYKGEWLTPEAADYLTERYYRLPEYQMWISKCWGANYLHFVVDASSSHFASTMGRNINHSVQNANVIQRVFHDAKRSYTCVYFRALRDIKKGEEILYHYGDARFGLTLGKWSEKIIKDGKAIYRRTCVSILPDDGTDIFRD